MSRALFAILFAALALLAGRASADAWYGPPDGPPDGPRGIPGKKIIYVAQDVANGGISGAFRGLQEAAGKLGWQLSFVDGGGNAPIAASLFAGAVQDHPDAIVIGGFDIEELSVPVTLARNANIVLVGWHAAASPGPTAGLFVNVATDTEQVAQTAAQYVVDSSTGPVGIVLFNDPRFSIANAKTAKMKQLFEACGRCSVLSVEDIEMSAADRLVPDVIRRLHQSFGKKWTHTVAINDLYLDNMNFPLREIGRSDIRNISAGDGSARSIERIRAGYSQQAATVAEPLTLEGWQLADELNRAFAGQPPSGYVSKPILVTRQLLEKLGAAPIDSLIPFKERYMAIWRGSAD